MRLLFVAPSAYLLGGVQDWLAQLVPELRRQGHQVVVAVPEGDHHQFITYSNHYPELGGSPFINLTGSQAGRRKALQCLLRRVDPEMAIGVNLYDLYPAARQLRRSGMWKGRVVMTNHAIAADYFADLHQNCDTIDAVIATNRLTCALACSWGSIASSRVFYAPYGVSVAEVTPRRPPSSQCLRLAWVGRFDQPQKRVHDLPLILQQLEADSICFQLSLAGDGPERELLKQSLQPWIQRGQVELLGRLSKQELLHKLYATHHVLLITSSWETGPIVAWEAMTAGMAIVSSSYLGSGLEGALQHGRTALIFDVGDASDAARQIALLRSQKQLAALGKAGIALVRHRYSTEASVRAWSGALERASALPALPPPAPLAPQPPQGKLDQLFSPSGAEAFRRCLGRRFQHRTAGSEWPHTGNASAPLEPLLASARRIDHSRQDDGWANDADHG